MEVNGTEDLIIFGFGYIYLDKLPGGFGLFMAFVHTQENNTHNNNNNSNNGRFWNIKPNKGPS